LQTKSIIKRSSRWVVYCVLCRSCTKAYRTWDRSPYICDSFHERAPVPRRDYYAPALQQKAPKARISFLFTTFTHLLRGIHRWPSPTPQFSAPNMQHRDRRDLGIDLWYIDRYVFGYPVVGAISWSKRLPCIDSSMAPFFIIISRKESG